MNYKRLSGALNNFIANSSKEELAESLSFTNNDKVTQNQLTKLNKQDIDKLVKTARVNKSNVVIPPYSDISEVNLNYKDTRFIIGAGSFLPNKIKSSIIGPGAIISPGSKITDCIGFGNIRVKPNDENKLGGSIVVKGSTINSISSTGVVLLRGSAVTHLDCYGAKLTDAIVGSCFVETRVILTKNNLLLGEPESVIMGELSIHGPLNKMAGAVTIFGKEIERSDKMLNIDIRCDYATNYVAMGDIALSKSRLLPNDLDLSQIENFNFNPTSISEQVANLINENVMDGQGRLIEMDACRHKSDFNLTNTFDSEFSVHHDIKDDLDMGN